MRTIRATKRLTNDTKRKMELVNFNVHDRALKGGTKEYMIYYNSNVVSSRFQVITEYNHETELYIYIYISY